MSASWRPSSSCTQTSGPGEDALWAICSLVIIFTANLHNSLRTLDCCTDTSGLAQNADPDIQPNLEVLHLCHRDCEARQGQGCREVHPAGVLLHWCTLATQQRQLGLSSCADSAPVRQSAGASPCRSQEAAEQAEAELLRTGALGGAGPLETICEERPPSRDTVQSSSLQEPQPEGEAGGCSACSLLALLHGWSVVRGGAVPVPSML